MSPLNWIQLLLFSLCVQIFSLFTYIVYYSDLVTTSFKNVEDEYDYIIVGSGTAGSLIAHRLSKETNYTFVVLEAGGGSHPLLDIPVLGPFMHKSLYDWQYETVPQEGACLAMIDRKCRLPQGKIIGGSSKLNNMVHVRGTISHYKNWFHGKYSEDYFKKHFEYIESNLLHLDTIKYESKLSKSILDAVNELVLRNVYSEFSIGFSKSKLSQRLGKRWSISDNIDATKHVISNVLVETVVFNDNTAVGVKINHSGKRKQINAKKGIILSAGTFNSPKILQLSGIGPKSLLNELKIPVIKNLPVGRNLQDHVATGLDLVLFNNSVSVDALDMINPFNLYKYFFEGVGPLTTSGCEVIGFASSKYQESPDLQFMVMPVGLSSDKGSAFRIRMGINDTIWENYFTKIFDVKATTILSVVLRPKSKGSVYINSRDPNTPPLIDPKYLSHKEDIETLITGLLFVKKIIKSKPMKDLGAYLNDNKFPGCAHFEFFSNSYLECYIRHMTLTSYHPIGTCSMGLPDSTDAVVDTSFRVLGIDKLFIADASVMPTLPSGNINAAVAMMASVFFDTNIGKRSIIINKTLYRKSDSFFEYIFNICLIKR